jgi:hypothetical protein
MGFGLVNGFIDRLYTQLGTTSNYSAAADLHTLQVTTASAKSFPACYAFISRSLITASNNGDSSASALKSTLNAGSLPTDCFLHRLLYRSDLVAPVVFFITSEHGPRRQQLSFSYVYPLQRERVPPSSRHLFLRIKNLLPSNRRRSVICFLAIAYKRILFQSRSLATAVCLTQQFLL